MEPRQPDPLWPPPQAPNPWAQAPAPQAPNPWAPNPWAAPTWQQTASPRRSPYADAAPSRGRRNAVIAALIIAVLVIAEIVVVGTHGPKNVAGTSVAQQGKPLSPIPADGVTDVTPLSATSGTRVYSDLFDDPNSGWTVGDNTRTSAHYVGHAYSMVVTGAEHWFSYAPYDVPAQQVLLSMQATESGDTSGRAGFGLLCVRGPRSDGLLRYEFVLNGGGAWFIERNDGPVDLSSAPTVIDEGTAPQGAGTTAVQVSAVCATLADGKTTRLAFFIEGAEVADFTDVAAPDGAGWLGGMISSGSADQMSTTQASAFSENSLGTPTEAGSNA